ncbi:hypothetical protein BH09DEP1_BH09DEP1_1350 [soil metagenome]
MKSYIYCLAFLLSNSTQTMLKVTATLSQENGGSRVLEFDIDSSIFAKEICHAFQVPYTEPTPENIQTAQLAHRDTCRALNRECVPLSNEEARALYNRVLGEEMLEAIKIHKPETYPLIIGLLAAKTNMKQSYLSSGS